jgi:hypothetical protein
MDNTKADWNRRRFLQGAGGGVLLSASGGNGRAAQTGNGVRCRIVDGGTGGPLSARLRLTDARGNDIVPLGHPSALAPDAHQGDVLFQSKRFAYVDGEFALDPRSLPLHYQVIKGYEYVIAEGEISSGNLSAQGIVIPLSRWSSLADRGWHSGDIHIHHISPRTCHLEMDAEDLNVANILTSDFTSDQSEFEGQANRYSSGKRLIYVNQEFRNDQLGHLCLLNLKRLVEPVKTMQHFHYPQHLGVCDQTHAQGGYVSWAPFLSWPGVEGPLDVAMEKLDDLEILCAIDPRGFPVFMRKVVPELKASDGLHLWYRLLNCGFRLTATAGTDKMTTFVTVGANRVFARVEGECTYQHWIDALKAGRTFVTNSPVLTFSVNGKEPGATLQFDSKRDKAAAVHVVAESQLRYDRLEIVSNGVVVAEATPSGRMNKAEIHAELPIRHSCWLAARVVEDLSAYRARGVDFQEIHVPAGTRLSDYYGTRRPETVFAHSSPVYLIRDGEAIRSQDDADYYVRYLDNAIHWLETEGKFARPSDKRASIQAFEQGRAVYAARAKEAFSRK